MTPIRIHSILLQFNSNMMFIIIILSNVFFSECDYFSKREIREIIELIEAKCYSKDEIFDLITKNPYQNGHPSSTYIFLFCAYADY